MYIGWGVTVSTMEPTPIATIIDCRSSLIKAPPEKSGEKGVLMPIFEFPPRGIPSSTLPYSGAGKETIFFVLSRFGKRNFRIQNGASRDGDKELKRESKGAVPLQEKSPTRNEGRNGCIRTASSKNGADRLTRVSGPACYRHLPRQENLPERFDRTRGVRMRISRQDWYTGTDDVHGSETPSTQTVL